MKDPNSTRVAFVVADGGWLGGYNYFRNLFAALRTLPGTPITPVLFTGKRSDLTQADFPAVAVFHSPLLDRNTLLWLLRKIVAKITGRDILFTRMLKRQGIAALSHHIYLGRQREIATISWVADFQHLHMPQNFTSDELAKRNNECLALCQCDRVILSSQVALDDMRGFSPATASRGTLLHFVANPAPTEIAVEFDELQRVYQFTGLYFLLPNQFWAHKNHRVVIDALKILKDRGQPMVVLATGVTDDYRNPSFFPSLMEHATQLDVLESFRVLGKIPFDHLVGLMENAVAFLNPSRFEGWSTSVEEAKSLGKQIVLSDIPVHREQAPPRSFYFPPDDAAALADALLAASRAFDPNQDKALQQAARHQFSARQQAYGEAYRQIVLAALSDRR